MAEYNALKLDGTCLLLDLGKAKGHVDLSLLSGGGGSASWGDIAGTLSAQTDLQTALNLKANTSTLSAYLTTANAATIYFPIPTGTIAQYLRGNGTLTTFPTALSSFTNDSAFITTSALSGYLTSATAASTYQPLLVSGTSIKTINSASVLGSGNIVAGDATLAGTQTFTGVNTFSQNIQVGNTTGTSTATPLTLNLGGTYSNTAGANPKIKVIDTGSAIAGIGYSLGLMEFQVSNATGYAWYINASEKMRLSSGGRFLLGSTTDNGVDIFQVTGTSKFTGNVTVAGDILPSDNTKNLGGSTRWASLQMNGGINFYGGSTYNIKPESFSTPSGVAFAATIQTANASAIVDIQSTTKGFLPPRHTTTERNAVATPAEGLIVYDKTLHKLCVYNGSAWETITSI